MPEHTGVGEILGYEGDVDQVNKLSRIMLHR